MSKKAKKVVKTAATEKKAASTETKATEIAAQKTPNTQHIKPIDKNWNKYLKGLVKQVKQDVKDGHISFYLAWRGFVDDAELGYPNIYDYGTLVDILMANGYCPECANNFLQHFFLLEKTADGKKLHYCVINRDMIDMVDLEEEATERLLNAAKEPGKVKHERVNS